MPFTLNQLEHALGGTAVGPIEASFLQTYRQVIVHFSTIKRFSVVDFIVGAHIIYGWMPTMLQLNEPSGGYENIVRRLNQLKEGDDLTQDDLLTLKRTINNSVVGASKFLHCLSPAQFAIWDSRVYKFIHHKVTQYQLGRPDNYLSYLSNCSAVARQPGFEVFHRKVIHKMGYAVSQFRAIEWVMYMNSPR